MIYYFVLLRKILASFLLRGYTIYIICPMIVRCINMTTTVVKWGNSRGIRLPKPFLESLNLKENDQVDLFTEDNRIIIQKVVNPKHKTIRQRVEEFYGKDFETVLKENSYDYNEADWGQPEGNEIW